MVYLNLEAISTSFYPLLIPGAVLAASLVAGWFSRTVLFRFLNNWARKSPTRLDDHLFRALRAPFMLWVLIAGLYLAAQSSPLSPHRTAILGKVLLLLWIVSLTIVASRMAGLLIREYGRDLATPWPVTTLTQTLASLTVAVIGGLILLNTLGISITPVLTALGVGGLAVALALQDTLSNLFAGFYISLAGQVRVGDYVKLDTGEEGYVADISWRSTTLRALPNNLIIVPNSKLGQAILTNYSLPEKRMSLLVPISVSYESDPDRVEQVLLEEALAAVQNVPGLLAEPAPFVRFIPGFGDSSLDFTLICQVAEFVDQYLAQHELRKRIFKRFREEGIEIPFPIRTLYIKPASADGLHDRLPAVAHQVLTTRKS
jgi:small-conductance mechanosensitive channel